MHKGDNSSPTTAYPRLFLHRSIPNSVLQHLPSIAGKITDYGFLEHLTHCEFPVSAYINLTRTFPMAWFPASIQKSYAHLRFCASDGKYHVFFVQQLLCADYCSRTQWRHMNTRFKLSCRRSEADTGTYSGKAPLEWMWILAAAQSSSRFTKRARTATMTTRYSRLHFHPR